jgi:hypothetical protein
MCAPPGLTAFYRAPCEPAAFPKPALSRSLTRPNRLRPPPNDLVTGRGGSVT